MGSRKNVIEQWDITTGTRVRQYPGYALSFTTQGDLMLTRPVRVGFLRLLPEASLWDVKTGKLLQHFETATAAALSADGRYVLTGHDDGTAML